MPVNRTLKYKLAGKPHGPFFTKYLNAISMSSSDCVWGCSAAPEQRSAHWHGLLLLHSHQRCTTFGQQEISGSSAVWVIFLPFAYILISNHLIYGVLVQPLIKVSNQLVAAPLDSDVVIQCYVEASPSAMNSWYRDNGEFYFCFHIIEFLLNTVVRMQVKNWWKAESM